MALVTLVPPAVEPVSLVELKDFLRIDQDDTANDPVITSLGIAARQWAEVYTQKRFISQTVQLSVDFFPGYIDMKLAGAKVSSPFVSGSNAVLVGIRYAMILPYPPVQSITTFAYQNANGTVTTLNPATDYISDLLAQPARLMPPFGQMWPVARVVANAVEVTYVVGYGADETKIPEGIKTGIKLLTNHWYENRLPDESSVPMAVKAVLSPYRDLRF